MLSLDENAEMLSRFGLTRNQAKVYIATAQLRMASISEVSKVSKVRREDVYRMLPKLEKMGLIEKILGKPTKIRATPVEDALSILIKREQDMSNKKISALKANKDEFLKHFKPSEMKLIFEEEEAHFALLSEREAILVRMRDIIKNAKRELDIVYSRNKLTQFICTFAEQLKKTISNGVKVRIISEVPDFEDPIPRIMEEHISPGPSMDLRYTDMPSSNYILADFSQVLIATTTEEPIAEKPCLWTNSDSLVRVFQESFEGYWQNSVSWKTIETRSVPEKLTRFVEQLRPTNHLIFVYDSPEAKYNVLFNYLKAGLEKGEAVVYVASEENPTQIREAIKRFGIEVEKFEKAGALQVLRYEDIYIKDGEFDIATTINSWKKLYNKALKNGFKGLRVTGETAWFFKRRIIPELIEYEKTLHRVLNIPMIAICAYNANDLNKTKNPVNIYSELARAHCTVLFAGLDKKLGRMEIRKV